MITYVLDASALVELVIGSAPAADLVRRVRTGVGAAPELIDVESVNVLRRLRRGAGTRITDDTIVDVREAPLSRTSHRSLLTRIWDLRDSLTAYDAAYVALAEQLGVPLLTCDTRLGRAHGHDAEVIVYPSS